MRVAADGHTVLSPQAAKRLVHSSAGAEAPKQRARRQLQGLAEREGEVPACLGEGLSNAQIGARLHLSEATVKGYVARLLPKLNCANRVQPAGLRSRPCPPLIYRCRCLMSTS